MCSPEFLMADRTRSLASSTALSGNPTILNNGRPLLMSASTSTGTADSPSTAALWILSNVTTPMDLFYTTILDSVGSLTAEWHPYRLAPRAASPNLQGLSHTRLDAGWLILVWPEMNVGSKNQTVARTQSFRGNKK